MLRVAAAVLGWRIKQDLLSDLRHTRDGVAIVILGVIGPSTPTQCIG
jgi:hypothetical protein